MKKKLTLLDNGATFSIKPKWAKGLNEISMQFRQNN